MPSSSPAILFVCLGNICRSPLAAVIAQRAFAQLGIATRIASAGTGNWHMGQPADERALTVAAAHGYDLTTHRARQVEVADFRRFDWLLAMDHDNLAALRALAPTNASARVALLLDAAGVAPQGDVADPYYGGAADFETTLQVLEDAIARLATRLIHDRGNAAVRG